MSSNHIALSGQLHILLSITEDAQGGYHVSETAEEMLAGASLITAVKYGGLQNRNLDLVRRHAGLSG